VNGGAAHMIQDWSIVSDWESLLEELPPDRRDVYFTGGYVDMNIEPESVAECFVARNGDDLFLFPYMRRPVKLLAEGYFDIESPYGYGGPITNSDERDFTRACFGTFCEVQASRGVIACFIRFHPLLDTHLHVSPRCEVSFDRKTVGMDLTPSVDDIWMHQVHAKHRNAIRKAEKAGLRFSVDSDLEHLDEFIALYSATMEAVGAKPFYHFDRGYFDRLMAGIGDYTELCLAELDDRVIAGALFMRYGVWGHYHLAASDREHLGYSPNSFILHHAALDLKERGCRVLHLGGGTDTTPDNSLYRFKRRFGALEYDFYIGKVVIDPAAYAEACERWEREFGAEMAAYRPFFLKYRQLPRGVAESAEKGAR
jgi:serine/alanine adding enzyme